MNSLYILDSPILRLCLGSLESKYSMLDSLHLLKCSPDSKERERREFHRRDFPSVRMKLVATRS